MSEANVSKSAGYLTWGLVLLVVGGGVADSARQSALEASLRGFGVTGTSPWLLVGGVVALVGLFALVIGVHQLAVNVDFMALDTVRQVRNERAAHEADGERASTPTRDVLPPARERPTTGP